MNYPISHSTDDNKQHRGQTDCHHDQYTSCPVPFVIAICNPAYCLHLKSTTCPSSITRIRSATCAISSSWVIITIVCPYFFAVILSRAITSSLVLESRFPVGCYQLLLLIYNTILLNQIAIRSFHVAGPHTPSTSKAPFLDFWYALSA